MRLEALVLRAAAARPQQLAVQGPQDSLTYGELDALANQVARALQAQGVQAGDRVGICLDKSATAVACMQAILRLGAAYVPIDPMSPPQRARAIVENCQMRAVVATAARAEACAPRELPRVVLDPADPTARGQNLAAFSNAPLPPRPDMPNELAYILYTSGSTGTPKGVCISHQNALAFVEWAAGDLRATAQDRFSNHAPFHFDISVLDLYVAFCVGGSVHLIPEGAAYVPQQLVAFIQEVRPTIWYSVPSALVRMMEDASLLQSAALPMHTVVFAGEPFPIKHLARLQGRYPQLRLLNYYGPTETNVCTSFEVTQQLLESSPPLPIGRASCGDRVWAVDEQGQEVPPGQEGELWVTGPTVMLGYWGKPPQGTRPYPTGDRVVMHADGTYVYIGRRDHMVKVRGYRVELGDIEVALAKHSAVQEVLVVVTGEGSQARLTAVLAARPDVPVPTLLDLKAHCASLVPKYMIIDRLRVVEALPRTRNGKVDRAAVLNMLG